MSATRAVIDFIRDASIEDMPERLLSEGRRCVLDGVGVILAGTTDHCAEIVRAQMDEQGGTGNATVFGAQSSKAPSTLAASRTSRGSSRSRSQF